MHVNKVHHVTTINRVAEQLGADEDWLRNVADERLCSLDEFNLLQLCHDFHHLLRP